MIRILAFIGGLSGAVGLSQFPEFSQQYLQRLGGAVDGLRPSVQSFDKQAKDAGITRDEALARYTQSQDGFLIEQGRTRASEISRFETLDADYTSLREAQPLQRLALVYRFSDATLVRATWHDFRPAVPATFDGVICAAIGYGLAWLMVMLGLSGLARLFRGKETTKKATT